jgi:hypothetical protein
MWLLVLFILLVLLVGIWGAVKLTMWALLIAALVAVVIGLLGRGMFTRSGL